MDWSLFWTILAQLVIASWVLRIIILPWEYKLYRTAMNQLEQTTKRRTEPIL